MRFHVGFSFRPKNIKKFLIPFLLGLGAYFGLSSFNLLQVKAYSNYSTYFNYNYDEIDFDDYIFIDEDNTQYSLQDIIDLANNNNTGYKINIFISSYYEALIPSYIQSITFRFVPSSYESLDFTIYNQRNSSSSGSNYDNYRIWNDSTYNGFSIDINNQYSGKTSTAYSISDLKDCLLNNNCPTSSNGIKRYTIYTDTKIDNSHSYSIDLWNNTSSSGMSFLIPYKTEVPLILRQYGTNSNYYYLKSIKVNDTDVAFDTEFPTYCDLYSCSSGGDNPPLFTLFLNKLPFIYTSISKNNISSYQTSISFEPTSLSVDDYVYHLLTYKDFFGRVEHGTYYSYEKINCSLSSLGSTTDTTISINFDNLSCSSSLTNYDKIFVTYYFTSDDNTLDYSIGNFSTTSSGFLTINSQAGNDLVDDFNFSSSGFNILLSTNVYKINNNKVYIWTDNDFVVADEISNSSTLTDITTNGSWYKDYPPPHKHTFGLVTNTNLMIYDDISYGTQEVTNIYLYLDKDTIVSIGNNNMYSYYDSSGSIVDNTIYTTYDTIEDNGDWSAIDTYTEYALNYLVSMQQEIYTLHNVINNIYDSIPLIYRSFIFVLFVIGLLYILYREVKR